MTNPHRWWRRLAATVAATAAVASTQAVLATPAHAGQVGVSLSISGRGTIQVVEGRSGSDPAGCSAPDAVLNLEVKACGRWRTEAPFEAWVWLRAAPGTADGADEWVFDSWSGCDKTRTRQGYLECGVGSGAFSSDEKDVRAAFRDVVAPQPPSVTVLTRPGVERTVDYRFSTGTTTDRFECRFDDLPTRECSASGSRQLPEGPHALEVRAWDVNGNFGELTRRSFFVVDTEIRSSPPALSSSSTAEFTFSSGIGTTFRCGIETSPSLVPCPGGTARFEGLWEGNHVFTVYAERDGWRDPVPAVFSWKVDTIAPTTRVVRDGYRGNAALGVAVSASETSTSECRTTLEGVVQGPWAACRQDINVVSGLQPSVYHFEARSTDAAGNVGSVATYRHVASAAGPAVSLTPTIVGSSASFVLTAPDAETIQCRQSHLGVTGQFGVCESPFAMDDLADGEHLLEVRAWDRFGNLTTPAVTYRWTVGVVNPPGPTGPTMPPADTTAPDTVITGGPVEDSIVAATEATMTATAAEASTFTCTLDGLPRPCPSGRAVLSGLAPGRHTLTMAATDAAGNRDPSPATRSWSVAAASRTLVPGRKKAKGFKLVSNPRAYAGVEAVAKRKGATLTTTVTDVRTIALVAAPGRGQGKVTVSLSGGRKLATLSLSSGNGTTQVLTLPALAAPYTGPVLITARTDRPVRIQGIGTS